MELDSGWSAASVCLVALTLVLAVGIAVGVRLLRDPLEGAPKGPAKLSTDAAEGGEVARRPTDAARAETPTESPADVATGAAPRPVDVAPKPADAAQRPVDAAPRPVDATQGASDGSPRPRDAAAPVVYEEQAPREVPSPGGSAAEADGEEVHEGRFERGSRDEAWGFAWNVAAHAAQRLIVAGVDPASAVGRWGAQQRAQGLRAIGRGDEVVGVNSASDYASIRRELTEALDAAVRFRSSVQGASPIDSAGSHATSPVGSPASGAAAGAAGSPLGGVRGAMRQRRQAAAAVAAGSSLAPISVGSPKGDVDIARGAGAEKLSPVGSELHTPPSSRTSASYLRSGIPSLGENVGCLVKNTFIEVRMDDEDGEGSAQQSRLLQSDPTPMIGLARFAAEVHQAEEAAAAQRDSPYTPGCVAGLSLAEAIVASSSATDSSGTWRSTKSLSGGGALPFPVTEAPAAAERVGFPPTPSADAGPGLMSALLPALPCAAPSSPAPSGGHGAHAPDVFAPPADGCGAAAASWGSPAQWQAWSPQPQVRPWAPPPQPQFQAPPQPPQLPTSFQAATISAPMPAPTQPSPQLLQVPQQLPPQQLSPQQLSPHPLPLVPQQLLPQPMFAVWPQPPSPQRADEPEVIIADERAIPVAHGAAPAAQSPAPDDGEDGEQDSDSNDGGAAGKNRKPTRRGGRRARHRKLAALARQTGGAPSADGDGSLDDEAEAAVPLPPGALNSSSSQQTSPSPTRGEPVRRGGRPPKKSALAAAAAAEAAAPSRSPKDGAPDADAVCQAGQVLGGGCEAAADGAPAAWGYHGVAGGDGVGHDFIGKRVLISGLLRSPEFNNQWGRVESYDRAMQRFLVSVHMSDSEPPVFAKLRQENLVIPPTVHLRFDAAASTPPPPPAGLPPPIAQLGAPPPAPTAPVPVGRWGDEPAFVIPAAPPSTVLGATAPSNGAGDLFRGLQGAAADAALAGAGSSASGSGGLRRPVPAPLGLCSVPSPMDFEDSISSFMGPGLPAPSPHRGGDEQGPRASPKRSLYARSLESMAAGVSVEFPAPGPASEFEDSIAGTFFGGASPKNAALTPAGRARGAGCGTPKVATCGILRGTPSHSPECRSSSPPRTLGAAGRLQLRARSPALAPTSPPDDGDAATAPTWRPSLRRAGSSS